MALTRYAATATLVLSFGGLAVVAPASAAASGRSSDSVSVSGHGSVKGTPDTLIADMDAFAKRDSASDALNAASQTATSVINALEANGVDASDIQTSGVSVGQSYGAKGKVDGYRADETITARMHPLSTASSALDAASTAGGDSLTIQDTSLTISHKEAYESKARAKAFASAKAAAQQYAELSGRQLGRVEQITATTHGPGVEPVDVHASGGVAAGSVPEPSVPISPGKQTISASVRVIWALR